MYEILVFNKILRESHFSEGKAKEYLKLLKTTLTLFFDLIINSMSDITNITPRYIQNTHARDLLNHVKIKREATTT